MVFQESLVILGKGPPLMIYAFKSHFPISKTKHISYGLLIYEIPDTAWVGGKLKISKLKNKHIFISISFFMVRRRTILESVSGSVALNTNFK